MEPSISTLFECYINLKILKKVKDKMRISRSRYRKLYITHLFK